MHFAEFVVQKLCVSKPPYSNYVPGCDFTVFPLLPYSIFGKNYCEGGRGE